MSLRKPPPPGPRGVIEDLTEEALNEFAGRLEDSLTGAPAEVANRGARTADAPTLASAR